ncbi:MAG: type II toxin-antitoxin system RelE/ParE family toxin [Spirochaetota bacterium]
MYKIEIERRCLKELKKLDVSVLQKAFEIIENSLTKNPFIGKPLKGRYKGLYSFRFSDYRSVYAIPL